MRQEVKDFADAMEERLQANDYKGGWDNCRLDWLWKRIAGEHAELMWVLHEVKAETMDENITPEAAKKIIKECADVANFAMMIADRVKYKIQRKEKV